MSKQEVQESFEMIEKQLSSLLYQLLKPEYGADYINPELIKEARKKVKGQQYKLADNIKTHYYGHYRKK